MAGFQKVDTKSKKRQRRLKEGLGDLRLAVEKQKQHRGNLRILIRKHGGRCALCGEFVTMGGDSPTSATIDHIVAKSKGGLDRIDNMQLACYSCNQKKGAG